MSPDRHGSGATRIEADLSSTEERELMRRASTCLAVLALAAAALALPSFASAAPTVTLKALAVPIPKPGGGTWPGTGNIYGAGAAAEAEFHISGTEYGGFPPPLIGVNFYLPTGTIQDEEAILVAAREIFGDHMRPVLEREFPLPDLVARSKAVARMMKEGLVSFRQRGSRWLWQLRIWRCDRV